MTKQTIEVEVPEGWKVKEQRLIIEKIQPRRIVLEETGEVRKLNFKDFYADGDGFLCRWMFDGESGEEYKIWREVK